jgi:hypothetical protein
MWIAIAAAVALAVVLVFAFSLCRISAQADAALERFRREGWL